MAHYTLEELELYRHGGMSVLGRIGCSAHLKKCAECRKKLKTLEKDDLLIADLRQSMRLYSDIAGVAVHSKR